MPVMLFVDACCDVSLFVLFLQIYITTNCQQYCVLFASKYLICLDAISDTETAMTYMTFLGVLRGAESKYAVYEAQTCPKMAQHL